MRRSLILALTMAAVLGFPALLAPAGSSPKALAAEGCGVRSLHGAYGYAFQGQVIPPGTTEFDTAIAGRIVFDAHGGLSGSEWDSANGFQETLTFTGSYSIQPDCTGTAALVNSNGRTDHITLGLIEGGQEFNFTVTDPGVVITGQPSRLGISRCTDRSLSGVFNATASGSDFTPAGVENGDDSLFFSIHFDGHGHESGSATLNINGFSFPDTFTGTYHVNPDCTGSATNTFASSGSDAVNFVIVEQGNEVKFFNAQPGIVFSGTMDRMANGEESGQN
ncbi:MAG TPA: hypothetical protein VII89_05365 [Candidatus Dormibacteraeota bacterium]